MKDTCKMVIVEDDPLSLQILASVLERKFKDIEVFTASNGREGLEYSTTSSRNCCSRT